MDPKKFASQPKRVGGSGKVTIADSQHLDPDYEIKCLSDWKATRSGLVSLIEINPKKENLPSFILRWDSNYKTVDVDILVDGKDRKDLWKDPGYDGHHPKRIKGLLRRYEVDIKMPDRKIFVGIVNIGLLHEVYPEIEIEITDTGINLTSNLPFPNLPAIRIR